MSISAAQYLNNSNTEKSFIGVFHYTRPVRSKNEESVEIYGLLSVSSEVNIPGQNIAKFAWDGLVDGFEYSNEDSVNNALKVGLNESTRRVKQLIVNDKEIAMHGVDVNFTVFVSTSSGLYVGCLGEGDIYIYKKDRIVDIAEMLKKKNAKTAGLVLDENDLLFTSSASFLKNHLGDLTGLSNREGILEVLDSIANELTSGEGLLLFVRELGELKEKEPVLEEKVEKEVGDIVSEDITPLPKQEILKTNKERDLKSVLTLWYTTVITFFKGIKLPKLGIRNFLERVLSGIKKIFKSFGSRIVEIFGKKKWFKRISAKVTQTGKRKEGFKGFAVDGYKVRNKKRERFKVVGLVVLVIVLLVSGVKFTLDQKEAKEISNEANGIFTLVDDLVSKAEQKVSTDRQSAETAIFRAKEELAKVPEELNKKDLVKYEQLEGKVLGIQDSLYKIVGLADSDGSIETYLDTRLGFGEGSKPTDITIYQDDNGNEYLLVVDSALKGVFRISLYDKEVKRLPDSERILQDPRMIYIGKSGVFVLDFKVGVARAEFTQDGWFGNFSKLTGLGIENIGADDIAEFAVLTDTDNVYVLDRESASLYKSSNFGSGYGLSYAYLKEDSFKEANDILADLSVYILTSGENGLHRYIYSFFESKQIPSPLEVLGLDGTFKNLTYGYTRDNLNYDLYLFDKEDKRVMRFEKPMEGGGEIRHPNQVVLINQYLYRGSRDGVWEKVNDFVVNRDQKFMYLLDSSTIWKVRL
jgi:hypothetical protein